MTPSPPPPSQPRDLACFNHREDPPVPNQAPPTVPPFDYPLIAQALELIEADKPGQGFSEFENSLVEAGVVLASQAVMLPEDVLSVIGNMGNARARIIRNYAKRVVLPLLGLQGNYDEPEITVSENIQKEGRTISREGSREEPDEDEVDDYEEEICE